MPAQSVIEPIKVTTFSKMNPDNICYFNGEFVPYGEMHLHVSDLQIQRGYGIFDFFRIRNGQIPWLEDYMDRIFNSLELSGIETDLGKDQFREIIHRLHQKNKLENGAFKVIVTGGYSETLSSVTDPSNFLILNVDWKKPPEATFEKGVPLIRDRFIRPHPLIKTLYYFNTLRLQKKMQEDGAADVMFHTDTITEASRANLFFVKKGRISTPGQQILRGITRKQVLALFEEIRVEDVPHDRLFEFDEIFMTATSRDITPVVRVDGRKIGTGAPGPVTREIQEAFRLKGW